MVRKWQNFWTSRYNQFISFFILLQKGVKLLTREEIISKLKELRKQGYTYKGIASAAKLYSADQLYKFIYRNAPAKEVMHLLEIYLQKIDK